MLQNFKANRVNLLAIGIIGGLAIGAFAKKIGPSNYETWQMLCAVALLVSGFAAVFNYWRLLKISEAPISTIAAAAQGYVELHGTASTENSLKTPFHGIPCVWYRAWVYANVEDQKGLPDICGNRLLNYHESNQPFTLNDGTASCTINPKDAEVVHFEARTWRKNAHRYVEQYLPAAKKLYVLGQLNTLNHLTDKAALNLEVRNTLADWKSRPDQLRNRYDHNWDGKIDADEWELARQDAIKQATAKQMMAAHTGNFTLSKPADNHLFLISAKSPQQLRNSYQHWSLVHIVTFLFLLFALYLTPK